MGVVTNVVASFTAACKSFGRIKDQQPSDQYITSILEVLVPILYASCWDVDNRTQHLVGLLLAEAPYAKKHKEEFPWPTKIPEIYSTTLNKEDTNVVRVKGDATHKESKRTV